MSVDWDSATLDWAAEGHVLRVEVSLSSPQAEVVFAGNLVDAVDDVYGEIGNELGPPVTVDYDPADASIDEPGVVTIYGVSGFLNPANLRHMLQSLVEQAEREGDTAATADRRFVDDWLQHFTRGT